MVKYMLELEVYFYYCNVDVSIIKELVCCWKLEVFDGFIKQGMYQVLDDICEFIVEMQFYCEKVFSI